MEATTEPVQIFQQYTKNEFSSIDYYLFGGMLGLSVLIGIYFGFFGTKQSTKNEYLMGGRIMKVIPIAISLVASYTSGIALLAVPADIYKYGSNYIWICNAIILSCIASSYIYLPVFHKLQLTSSYEYLKMRFDKRVRILASFLYALSVLLSSPIVIYVPALAFSHATGTNVYLVALVVCSICIFYTTIGGVKAVVWTDTLQTVVMAASMVLVFLLGIISAGGFWNIIDTAEKRQRLDLDFGMSPTVRDSFWTFTLGATSLWLTCIAVSQVAVQRLLSVPTLSDARWVLLYTCIGITFVKASGVFTGLIMFAKYSDCDPLLSKQITRNDQLLPYYVIDVAGHIPGLSGLFISGVLGAALSTLSGTLNAAAATIYEDFILPFMPKGTTEKQISYILRIIVVVAGAVFTASVFIVEHLGGLLPLATSFNALTGGALLGLFTLGMLFPTANATGALVGGVSGLLVSTFVIIGNLWHKNHGNIIEVPKPLSVYGCSFPVNITTTKEHFLEEEPFYLFRVSFWYHGLIGAIVTIVLGLIVSWITRKSSKPVHPDLLSPLAKFFMNKLNKTDVTNNNNKQYLSVDKAMQLLQDNTKFIGLDGK